LLVIANLLTASGAEIDPIKLVEAEGVTGKADHMPAPPPKFCEYNTCSSEAHAGVIGVIVIRKGVGSLSPRSSGLSF
jgi:hypothetical protein